MIAISRHGSEVLDELRPLWLALVEHHHAVAPQLGEVHPEDETWRRRRAQYEEWLAEPDAFVLLARLDGRAVGYALVRVIEGSPTWARPERVGELETLSLLPEARGHGAGAAMLDRVDAELEAIGIRDLGLVMVAGNEGAQRFYERRGFTPVAVVMRRSG